MWHSPYELPEHGDRILVRYSDDTVLGESDIFIYDKETGIGLNWEDDVEEWARVSEIIDLQKEFKKALSRDKNNIWNSCFVYPKDGQKIYVKYYKEIGCLTCGVFVYSQDKGIEGVDWDDSVDSWIPYSLKEEEKC